MTEQATTMRNRIMALKRSRPDTQERPSLIRPCDVCGRIKHGPIDVKCRWEVDE